MSRQCTLRTFHRLIRFYLSLNLHNLYYILVFNKVISSNTGVFRIFGHINTFNLSNYIYYLARVIGNDLRFVNFTRSIQIINRLFHKLMRTYYHDAECVISIQLVIFRPFRSIYGGPKLKTIGRDSGQISCIFFGLRRFLKAIFNFLYNRVTGRPILARSKNVISFLGNLIRLLRGTRSNVTRTRLNRALHLPLGSHNGNLHRVGHVQ